jgi:hypothetical protein
MIFLTVWQCCKNQQEYHTFDKKLRLLKVNKHKYLLHIHLCYLFDMLYRYFDYGIECINE